ncbi:MAG: hypothetical protein H7Y12_02345 [Sphingobacteriaceae bacterium]|nr:hypothetical protein [Cytophagaceae bacterium]
MNRLLLLCFCIGLLSCAGSKSRKFLAQTRTHRTIAVVPAVFSVSTSSSASDVFDPFSNKVAPLNHKFRSVGAKPCEGCKQYAFELQKTIHRLLTTHPEDYRVVVLSLDETNRRLGNYFLRKEAMTQKKAAELAQMLGVDALLVPVVGLTYQFKPNFEFPVPVILPLFGDLFIGTVSAGIAQERWFPQDLSVTLMNGTPMPPLWGIGDHFEDGIVFYKKCRLQNVLPTLPEALPYRISKAQTGRNADYYAPSN